MVEFVNIKFSFMSILLWKRKRCFFLTTTGCLQLLNKTRPCCRERPGLWGLRRNASGLVAAQSQNQSTVRPKPSSAPLLTQTPYLVQSGASQPLTKPKCLHFTHVWLSMRISRCFQRPQVSASNSLCHYFPGRGVAFQQTLKCRALVWLSSSWRLQKHMAVDLCPRRPLKIHMALPSPE